MYYTPYENVDYALGCTPLQAQAYSKEQWLQINHYSNLQLLWANLNTEKSDKIPKKWKWNDEKHAWEGDPDSWKD